ncbi:MAG: TIGR02391 family protein [Patescibacteria group bacterium]|nr:TIGR02391 family protein [Patescibacteria group bacterium]
MSSKRLDRGLMSKIAKKIGEKNIYRINVIVSKQASKLGISSEASLVLLAKKYGIGVSTYQKSLDSIKQTEIRDSMLTMITPVQTKISLSTNKISNSIKSVSNKKSSLKLAIEYLIEDKELLDRCGDILLASKNFDRPINQATLVLEDRIRTKSQPTKKLVGENLVGYAFNEDISKSVLKVESMDSEDQRGFTQILRGIFPLFRNKTHHHVIKSFSREEAMRVCGFIDVILRIVDKSNKTTEKQ